MTFFCLYLKQNKGVPWSYKTFRKYTKEHWIRKASNLDWVCPHCSKANSTKADDKEKYQKHIECIENQRAYERSIKKKVE